ncbi:hypothetical protein ETD83_12675 [Actinomadura soli]|uniref:Uncharacterized protein n=1 Tax=Actinomadura soli TaxID=2508997 RepID=A0A5C4JED0_9ACTN|nr:hypothetical protein [Actinomadura soli]TMR02394.1 hypothetical protein ETD83_12675 [Actinomadura soli]
MLKPHDHERTVGRNVQERNADALPAVTGALPDLAPYRVVLLVVTEKLGFTGKTIPSPPTP